MGAVIRAWNLRWLPRRVKRARGPWVSPQNLIEVFPHHRAMVRVKDRQTYPLMSTRVSIPLRQIYFQRLAAAIQLVNLLPAERTWRVLVMERPAHWNLEPRYPHRYRRPFLVSHALTPA